MLRLPLRVWLPGTFLVAALGLLASLRAWRDSRDSEVGAAARVAILPFDVRGADATFVHLAEGAVDLLGLELEGAGALHVVPTGTVLSRWRRMSAGGRTPLDEDQIAALATDLKARYVVVGSLLFAGGRVRLAGAALEPGGRGSVAELSAAGPADSAVSLLARLGSELVRALVSPPGAPRIQPGGLHVEAAAPGAVEAYLLGLAALRAEEQTAAARWFARAALADSTFAEPLLALALVPDGWDSLPWTPDEWAVRAAQALAGPRRPPPPDSARLATALARALALALGRESPRAWLDAARRLVTRYPEDPQAWAAWGDALFHAGALDDRPARDAEAALARAVALDSDQTDALEHLWHLAMLRLDGPAAERYLGMLARRGREAAGELGWAGIGALRQADTVLLDRLDGEWAIAAERASDPRRRAAAELHRHGIAVARGRWPAAAAHLAAAQRLAGEQDDDVDRPLSPDGAVVTMAFLGYPSAAALPETQRRLEARAARGPDPRRRIAAHEWLALLDLGAGNLGIRRRRAAIAALTVRPADRLRQQLAVERLDALARLASGDTTAARHALWRFAHRRSPTPYVEWLLLALGAYRGPAASPEPVLDLLAAAHGNGGYYYMRPAFLAAAAAAGGATGERYREAAGRLASRSPRTGSVRGSP